MKPTKPYFAIWNKKRIALFWIALSFSKQSSQSMSLACLCGPPEEPILSCTWCVISIENAHINSGEGSILAKISDAIYRFQVRAIAYLLGFDELI